MESTSGKFRNATELDRAIWRVREKYLNLEVIGSGAYGEVCSAWDQVNGCEVAIKKLTEPFDSSFRAKKVYRELRLLKHMRHPNVLNLMDVFTPIDDFNLFTQIYLVTPLLDQSLQERMQEMSRVGVTFTEGQIASLVCQILEGLKYIHSAGIIHRDLKPANLAVSETRARKLQLKILDFGHARHLDNEMTAYVTARSYRAPDVILNHRKYNEKVDIWSVGCILAEMLTGRLLFAAEDSMGLLKNIFSVLGPPEGDLTAITEPAARDFLQNNPVVQSQTLGEILRGSSQGAIALVETMLALDPRNRPSAEDALNHSYLESQEHLINEPQAEPFVDPFERVDGIITLAQWKALIWAEIFSFRPT